MAFIVRDSGNETKYRFTVVIKTKLEELFYGFPEDTNSNYRFMGTNADGFHDSGIFGELADPKNVPVKWLNVIVDLEKEAEEFAGSQEIK